MLTRNWRNVLFLFSLVLLGALLIPAMRANTPMAQGQGVDLTTAITTVSKQAIPAVVHIEVTEYQAVPNPLLPFENDPFFRYFFGNPNMPKKFQREVMGLGTGVILDDAGRILTNNHVVGGATKIQVVLADGREFSGDAVKTIGTDPKTDLALIQIVEKGPFPHLSLGDSDKMEVGQWVVAIGHPRGLDQTVTQGIISAKHRRGISDPSSYQDFLQTDAAINPGNSGGPLLNLKGEVIGINAAILSQSGGSEGLGFAIPSNIAAHIVKQLIQHGKVTRGYLGVNVQDLTPELAKTFGIKNIKGALVADVVKGGPAEQAGVARGDVIVSYQGKAIEDASSLRNAVATSAVGSEIRLGIVRSGAGQELKVKVGNLEEQEKKLADSLKERYGIAVRPVAAEELSQYGIGSQQGVAITEVNPKGPFGRAGFEKDDIILQVNKQPVTGPDSLYSLLSGTGAHQRVNIFAVDHRSGQSGNIGVMLP